ncbi:titin homolog isoform X2 [Kryptolebias marmoratus]|uniref:non-specific serine/threonine protein kinase n=1 Tax=Kryptolebias marmoratus TaxID=37003 RepID=A0A3Q3AZ38_KRYMA|nr:titin homolog isoform X2 [Kryptolebias marmoratus]
MTSRRPMTRSFSGNGRSSSFNEEDGSSSNGRPESRNTYLSNVRPENRSTLCSVMAQLTEDIQPSFETTLKSKAVSENCNVKFICVVSGYPVPELKWYKDDMEMDRYCGLPKYEIHRNGKTHTLHIYNCTVDDAAIYQVSASNCKGIVSCSGVLEVGTMNEYKIHQRFFEKLKQKAEKKKRDLEEKKEGKENIQKGERRSSPEHAQRKCSVPPTEKEAKVNQSLAVEQPGGAVAPNAVSSGVEDTGDLTSMNSSLENEAASEEMLAKKRIKMSNGVDAEVNSSSSRSHIMGHGGENHYDGGISLAQFLAEALQSQAAEENQLSPEEEKPQDMETAAVGNDKGKDTEEVQDKLKEQEKELQKQLEREKKQEEDLATEREKARERQVEMKHTAAHGKQSSEVKHHGKAHKKEHKDHDHHNIHTSISSMLHTVKDFFFGKSKKDFHSHTENEDREFDHSDSPVQSPESDVPPSFQMRVENNKAEVSEQLKEETRPGDKAREHLQTMDIEQQSASEPLKPNSEDRALHPDLQPGFKPFPKTEEESAAKRVEENDEPVEAMEVSVEPESCSAEEVRLPELQVHPEVKEENSEVVSVLQEGLKQQLESDHLLVTQQAEREEEKSIVPQGQAPANEECPLPPTFTKSEDCWIPPHGVISTTESPNLEIELIETSPKEEISFRTSEKGEPATGAGPSDSKLSEEQKAEVRLNKQPFSDINRSEITKIPPPSLEDRFEQCDSKIPDQVLLPPAAVEACGAEKDQIEEETKCTSFIHEMNAGFPPTDISGGAEMGDLKMPHKHTNVVVEITEVNNGKASSNTSFKQSEERGESKDILKSALDEDLFKSLKAQTLKSEEKNKSLQLEFETEKKTSVMVEESDESNGLEVTQSNENNASEKGWSDASHRGNIPSIQISTIEDMSNIKPSMPDLSSVEQFIIPKIEIMEPELKECSLPLSILAQNKPEPHDLQKHDVTDESKRILQDQNKADFPGSSSFLTGMPSNDDLSPEEKVAQEMLETQKHSKRSEQLPRIEHTSIPVINVSCTDDLEGSAFRGSCTERASETPRESLFVVPPISVTCHESDPELKLPTPSKTIETETSAGTQRGTKQSVENSTNLEMCEISQDFEELSEKSTKENTPAVLCETLTPKVGGNVPILNTPTEESSVPENSKLKSIKDAKNPSSVEDFLKSKPSVERLSSKPPTYPSLSPSSLRKFMSKAAMDSDNETATNVPVISVDDCQSDKADEDLSGGSTPTSSLSCESSPRLKRRDSLTLIRSATPEELASGARRKIFLPRSKEEIEGALVGMLEAKKENPYMSPSQARRAALLQASTGQKTPPVERRSPLMGRRKATLEVPKVGDEAPTGEPASTKEDEKPSGKKTDPLKAPQVIRKIRGEPFPDASGHLKLWCQFFNVLGDSTIKWFKDEEEILEVKRSGNDETQVALAIVLACNQDCAVYGCTITNEYGSDTTDFLLSEDILSEILLKDDLEVGEEIEMTPLLFTKGLADSGTWGEKYFGRILTDKMQIGEGCAHKASRVKVIYGLDPIFESGSTCIIKIRNPIAYGTKQESNLAERNLDITKQECKVQNMIREYCKIFAAEARVSDNFGFSLEVIPRYLIYRPANSVPYATVETDLLDGFVKYCTIDPKGKLSSLNSSELEQKCCTFQHWIHQWTHGNLLVTQLEGVETKMTNIKVATKSKGYQGLTECGSPEVFDQFLTHHQCNYYCGLLGLRPLKTADLQQSTKIKGSKSPMLNRRMSTGSPQVQKKGHSPQMSRKASTSPKVARKVQEAEDSKSGGKHKPVETLSVPEMR